MSKSKPTQAKAAPAKKSAKKASAPKGGKAKPAAQPAKKAPVKGSKAPKSSPKSAASPKAVKKAAPSSAKGTKDIRAAKKTVPNGKAKPPAKKASAPKPSPKPPVKKPPAAPAPTPKKKAAAASGTKAAATAKTPPASKTTAATPKAEPSKKAAPASKTAAPAKSPPSEPEAKPAKVIAAATEPVASAAGTVTAKAPAPASKAGAAKSAASAPAAADAPVVPRTPTVSKIVPTATKSGAIYYDSHMHTPLCKHAWGEPEEYAAQGIKAGLKGIVFTCHCPMPEGFWPTVRMADSEFDTYLALVQRAADAYRGKLDVLLGLESEYFPGHEKWIESLHQRADFDYILGGVHWQAKEYLSKYETGTIESFRRTYFDHLAASAETGLYDCLAHPDLVKNYHPDSWCFAIIKNSAAAALDRIAKTGVAMELNTSGLNKSYSEMNPGNEMLRMMAERKIPVVVGSDAHRAQRVGEHFITALNNLVEAGFENVSYFVKRERVDLKISEVIASVRRAADANS